MSISNRTEEIVDGLIFALEDVFFRGLNESDEISRPFAVPIGKLRDDTTLVAYWDSETQQATMWRVSVEPMPQAEPPAWFLEACRKRSHP